MVVEEKVWSGGEEANATTEGGIGKVQYNG